MREMELLVRLEGRIGRSYPESIRQAQREASRLAGTYGRMQSGIRGNNQQLRTQESLLNRLTELRQEQARYVELANRRTANREEYRRSAERVQRVGRNRQAQQRIVAELELQLTNRREIQQQLKSEVSRMQNEIRSMREQRRNTSDSSERSQMSEELNRRRDELRQLQTQLRSNNANTRESSNRYAEEVRSLQMMQREMQVAQREARTLNQEIARNRAESQQINERLRSAGYDVNSNRLSMDHERVSRNEEVRQRYSENRNRMSNATANVSNAKGNFDEAVGFAESLISPFTSATKQAMELEETVSELKALTQFKKLQAGDTAGAEAGMSRLRAQYEELGATTKYTQKQVAEAQIFIARTGWNENQILQSTPHFLKLAAAGHMDIARATDIATNIMTAFGLQSEDTQHVTDVLAYTFNNSNQDLNMLGYTMKYAAPVAKMFGSSLEETAAMTKFMADAGVQGSQAGTSLRQIMLRMVTPPEKATKAMEENGITVADCMKEWNQAQEVAKSYGITMQEGLKPGEQMASIMEQIDKNMAGKSSHEKMAAFNAITGINAVSGAVNLFEAGAAKLKDFTEQLKNCDGTTELLYKTATDNASGSVTAMNSAIESTSIALGNLFLPLVKVGAEIIGGIANKMTGWIKEYPALAQWLGIIAALLSGLMILIAGCGLAFAVWGFVTSTIATIAAGFSFLITAIKGFTVVQWIATAASYAFSGAMMVLNAIMSLNPVAIIVIGLIALVGVIALVISQCDGLRETLINAWNDPQGAIHGFCELIKSSINSAVEYVIQRWNTLKEAVSHPIEAVLNFMDHGDVIGGNIGKEYQSETVQTAQAVQAVSARYDKHIQILQNIYIFIQ